MDAPDPADQPDPRAGRPDQPEPLRDPRLGAALTPSGGDGPRFGAVQVEVPWSLGPADGRHVLRDGSSAQISHVVVLETLGAPERRRLRPRGRSATPPPPDGVPAPAAVTTARATVIGVGRPLGDDAAAARWLAAAGEAELDDGLAVLTRLLQAHRIATADPSVVPVARGALIAARLGTGDGAGLAAGRLAAGRELSVTDPASPRIRRTRRRALVGVTRLTELLAGREPALVCEELALRARTDLDAGRPREAALQLLVALDAALAELPADRHAASLAARIGELRERRPAITAAAQAALTDPPDDDAQLAVADTLGRLEAALRARAAVLG